MALDLSAAAIQEKNKLAAAGAFLMLFDIDIPGESTIRLVRNNEDVVWPSSGGDTYTAFPIQIGPMRTNARGEIPTLSLGVSNVLRTLQTYLEAHDGGTGGTVTMRIVHSDHLDITSAEYETEYDIKSSSANDTWVTFSLGMQNPLTRRFPRDSMTPNHCQWPFRGVGCGFEGADYTATVISFHSAATPYLQDAGYTDWIYRDFLPGMRIRVSGSVLNDGEYVIDSLSGDTLYLTDDFSLTDEAAGASVTVEAICRRTLADCQGCGNATRFRGSPGVEASSD